MPSETPVTEAGRRLVYIHGSGMLEPVLAIEAEARAAVEDSAAPGLREALRELFDHIDYITGPNAREIAIRVRAALAAAPVAAGDARTGVHEEHHGNHEGYACGFSGPHCWECGEPWPCRASRRPSYIEVRTTACHAGSDGDCSWSDCPQNRDGEPTATGRHCPLDSIPVPAWSATADTPEAAR